MFKLFSRSRSNSTIDYSLLKVDMHSHLLPGIDDGAKDLDTSLELIRGMSALGYKKLITTPHIMWGMYQNTPAIINARLEQVRQAVQEQGIDITIEAAAEYFLDEHVQQLLEKKEPLLTIGSSMVLAEFSLAFPPMNTKEILFEMQLQGYQPVIVHPERYVYLQQNKQFYTELRDVGCIFQLNLLSLSGHYGRSVTELATYLLKNDFYTLVGTDLHHFNHLEALKRAEMTAPLKKLLEDSRLLNGNL
jgi:tyrosine-protein phosphatase YwqE